MKREVTAMNPYRIRIATACTLIATLAACHAAHKVAVLQMIDWQTSPLDLNLRGMNGARYAFRCASGKPNAHLLNGSGPYTDASSICTAAVHAGAINPDTGGRVDIEILPGQNRYSASMQNFIASGEYNRPWSGSFRILPPKTGGH
jgi:hypothetical protein